VPHFENPRMVRGSDLLVSWKPTRRSEQPMHIAEIKQAAILLGGTVAARRSSLLVKGMAKQEETAA